MCTFLGILLESRQIMLEQQLRKIFRKNIFNRLSLPTLSLSLFTRVCFLFRAKGRCISLSLFLMMSSTKMWVVVGESAFFFLHVTHSHSAVTFVPPHHVISRFLANSLCITCLTSKQRFWFLLVGGLTVCRAIIMM